jgi:hypothetical protein
LRCAREATSLFCTAIVILISQLFCFAGIESANVEELNAHPFQEARDTSLDKELGGVCENAADDVGAVGSSGSADGEKTLIEHWNGTKWDISPSVSPGTHGNALRGVTCLTRKDIWAVGLYKDDTEPKTKTLVEHWDGTRWTVVPSPNSGATENALITIAAVGPNDIWASGLYAVMFQHWNGAKWETVPIPNPDQKVFLMTGIARVSAHEVWSVGNTLDKDFTPGKVILRWNGTKWSTLPTPKDLHGILTGLAVISPTDIWVVGSDKLAAHYDGKNWQSLPGVTTGDEREDMEDFEAVAAVSKDDVWTVGKYRLATLIEHWDGKKWEFFKPRAGGELTGIAVISANDIWAVGKASGTGVYQTILHWDGKTWSSY